MSSSTPDIRTRLLIISDTHGRRPFDAAIHPEEAQRYGFSRPLPKADVAIHCGDLTTRSDVKEYQVTFDVMREIDAPLKLVIPGNHDCSMDVDFWEKTYARKSRYLPPETLDRLRQQPQETYAVVEKARQDGVHVLVAEGTYHFVLANGARLTVYASPWTPRYGNWGFQYDPDANIGIEGGHNFQIEEGTDVAMTHGPPYSILDMTRRGAEDAGCRGLLAAVRKARPRVHCFGHIHEAYGAMLMPWENEGEKMMLEWNGMDEMKMEWEGSGADRAEIVPLSLCPQDRETLGAVPGKHTLFVNAAIMDVHYRPLQSPWLVDLELPPPDAEHEVKAEQTKNVLSTPTTVGNFSW